MIYIILAALIYTAVILVVVSASRNASTNLVTAVSNFFAVFIPLVLVVPSLSRKVWHSQKYGILMAAASGILIGIFALLINKSYSVNKVGIVTPIVLGGSIFLSTIASYFIFKERITLTEAAGLVLLGLGLLVLIYVRATS
ncbi:hypothetical protein HYW35_01140 [Candidatus Saccharibacteria bacterium]|nr:hypothetical protein [Candidatus Saccharibacteria bacterium]